MINKNTERLAISVVMPVYNAQAYLNDSLPSILGQTFADFELIMIDDGSTDDSVPIIKSYMENDDRIVLQDNPHDFIRTLNTGIELARGKYIARMDADDIMLPHRLETQFQYMEANPDIDVCGSWMECFGADSGIVMVQQKHEDIISGMLLSNQMYHPAIMMRKSSLSRLPSFPNLYRQEFIYAEDYKLWTDLAMAGLRFANIQEALVRYRRSENQSTSRFVEQIIDNSSRARSEYVEFVSEVLVRDENSLFEVIDGMIGLVNDGKLTFDSMTQVIRDIYSCHLDEIRCAGKIKVLFCIDTLTGGGAEKLLIDILRRFDYEKYCADLLVFSRSGEVYFNDVPSDVRLLSFADEERLASTEYDVEVAFLEGPAVKYVAHRRSSARKIAWIHTDLYDNHWTKRVYNNIEEEIADYSVMDNIVFVSEDAKRQFNRRFEGISDVPQVVIHNLIDADRSHNKSTEFTVEKNKLALCCVGRLIPVKGHTRLISAVNRLTHVDGLDFEVWILGEGEQRHRLEELIEQHSLEDIVLLKGFQKNPYPYMNAADVFVLSSVAEGFPLVVAEALCLGKPIVATECAGHKELLSGGSYGMLVENSEDGIYHGLKEMITNETLRAEYARSALARSEIFDTNETMSQIYCILDGHIGKKM